MGDKSGMADAMDYALSNGDWTWENDLAVLLFFSIPLLYVIAAIVFIYIIYRFVKCMYFS